MRVVEKLSKYGNAISLLDLQIDTSAIVYIVNVLLSILMPLQLDILILY